MSVQFTGKVLTIATEIANNCQGLEAPFCQAECPMHTDAMGYVQLIREGKFDAAVQKIREKLFLPGTLGRICAHPCEKVCRREAEYGQSISIAALKRYAADKADREELWDTTFGHATGKTVAIVGSGPAGAQAAIDLRKEGHRVTIFERLPVLGGMLRVGIPAYRLPHAVLDFEYGYLDKLGVEIRRGVEVGKDIAIAHLREQYDAVILAHGAHIGMMPRVNGSDVAGITNAVEFLREIAFKRQSNVLGENVIVIGGGDVAMDCARSALRGGAKQVRLICLEKECDLPASKHEQESAAAEGVLFTFGWCVDDFLSTDGRVSGIRMKNCLAVIDETGRFNPRLGGDTHELQCDTVIFATGQRVADIADGMLKQTSGGRYLVDKDTLATDVPGVFVAGDAAGSTIAIEAMALGRKSAISVSRYLQGIGLTEGRNFALENSYKSKFEVPLPPDVVDLKRHHPNIMPAERRIQTFDECDLGLDDTTAFKEASRCLECECKDCMTECLMLNDFTHCPGELFSVFLAKGSIEAIVPYSCNMCNQCTLVCPKEYKLADAFAGMRKDFVKANKGKSPIKGHGAIDIHQRLSFSRAFTIRRKGRK